MQKFLTEILECPSCHHNLVWEINETDRGHIEEGCAKCSNCASDYPIQEGIGLFLTPDLPREDLWKQAESGLAKYLCKHPQIEQRLIGVPLEALNPADRFFRALVLEGRGQYAGAKHAENSAMSGMHTAESISCWEAQTNFLIEQLNETQGPVVDLASGRGYLVEALAEKSDRQVVATDFSPRVLRRNRRWFKFFDHYDRISLLAFDARRTPFKDGVIDTLTTNLGLPNIENPGELLNELRRITAGTFLAITQFYPPDDLESATALKEAGLSELIYREETLKRFNDAGWQVKIANHCTTQALPSPIGEVIEGARIDRFPIKATNLEWCLLVAR